MFKQRLIHYPNLKTVLMVESFIKKQKGLISKNFILNNIKKKIMRQTLNIILEYLELSGKIYIGKRGIEWVFEDSTKMDRMLRKAADSIT